KAARADGARHGRVDGEVEGRVDAAGLAGIHQRSIERARHRLLAAGEHLRLAPELDARLADRARARLSHLSALFGVLNGNTHQGSLARARNHLEAAGAHLGTARAVDRGTWARARARRA